jgi:hypothetical protein
MSDTYISKYSNNKEVSAAQYITEIICEHQAIRNKKDLHYRFWVTKEWAVYFRNQIASAHKLLQKYSSKAIVMALKDKDAAKIYSLRAPHLAPIIDRYQKIVESENNKLTIDLTRSDNVKYKTSQSENKRHNILSRLKELDNE